MNTTRFRVLQRQIFSIFFSFLLLLQNLLPATLVSIAIAQDDTSLVTASEPMVPAASLESVAPAAESVALSTVAAPVETTGEPTPEPEPAPSPSPETSAVNEAPGLAETPAPTTSSTSIPDTATQEISQPAEETPAPEATVEPTAAPTTTEEPSAHATQSIELAPVDESPAPSASPESSESPEPSASPTPSPSASPESESADPVVDLNETLDIRIEENIETIDPLVVIESTISSLLPDLFTDKPDYAPTEAAVITGSNYLPNTLYTIVISSADEPVVSHSDTFTTLDDGTFSFIYQLDGIYRPNYKAEVYDTSGTLVVSVTFTDSTVLCSVDVMVNDVPGQKDLTEMCYDTDMTASIHTTWNWDETAWSGGNTGDACNLFDTDGDGKVNYAICVTIAGDPAAILTTTRYSCGDDKPDRCSQPATLLTISAATSCNVTNPVADPLPGGDQHPNDTRGSCSIDPADVGGAGTTKLVDVCSYPSAQPNSDPSDCIIATSSNIKTGYLEIIKNISPTTDAGLFNLLIDSNVLASNIGHLGTTNQQQVLEGTHTFSESAGDGTDLSQYTTSVQCKDNNGTGSIIATTGSFPWTINVVKDKDIVCTVTNTRVNNASITIIKDADPNSAQDFVFTTSGTGLSGFTLDDDAESTNSNTKTFSNLAAGNYSVSETPVTGWSQTSATCTGDKTTGSFAPSAINLKAGENVTCTFVNTLQKANLTLVKNLIKDNGGQATVGAWTLAASGPTSISGASGTAAVTGVAVDAGEYTLSESGGPGTYLAGDWTCTNDVAVVESKITLEPGKTTTCTITNDDKAPSLTLVKKVINDEDGVSVANDWLLTATGLTSFSNYGIATSSATFAQGTYTLSENGPAGYSASSWVCTGTGNQTSANQIELTLGETAECTITNNDTNAIPAIEVTKSASPTSIPETGGLVTYTYTVKNLSTIEPVTITSLNDDRFGVLTGDADCKVGTVLTMNATCSFDTTFSVPAGGVPGSHTNIFTAQAEDNEKTQVSDSETESVDYTEVYPDISVTKTAANAPASVPEEGGSITYTFSVTNNALEAAFIQSLSDDKFGVLAGDADCKVNTMLAPGASCSFDATFTLNSGSAGTAHTNIFTATAADNDGYTDTATDVESVTYIGATIAINPLSATNDINDPHTFTATVMENPGTGFVAAQSETVNFEFVTNTAGATFVGGVSSCVTNSSGQCSVQINSTAPGSVTVKASSNVQVGSFSLPRATDGTLGSSVSGEKQYVAGKIIVEKQTLPDGSAQVFEFNPSWSVTNFNLSDGQQHDSGWLAPGSYDVSELVPTGWSLTNTSCSSSLRDVEVANALELDASETITCTFTNTQLSSLTVTKVANWNGVELDDNLKFNICIQGPSYPTTANCKEIGSTGGDLTWNNLVAGDYTVTEGSLGSEWSVQLPNGAISVPTAGGSATATVTNTRKLGSLTVTKVVNWNGVATNGGQEFEICITGPSYASGDCKNADFDGATLSWTSLIPGNYAVSETDPGSDWLVAVPAGEIVVPVDGGTASATVTNTHQQYPGLTVEKTSTTTSLTAPTTVTYSYLVTNSGNITVTGISLSDDNDNDDMSCPAATLAVGASMTCTATHTFTQAELDAGKSVDNIVTVSSNEAPDATDDLSIPVIQRPAIKIDKASTTASITEAGQVVPYTFAVSNVGTITLTGIKVSDPMCDNEPTYVAGDDGDNKLELTELWNYTCNHTVTLDEMNAGGLLANTVTADSNESDPATDTYEIPVTQVPSLTIVKTATPTTYDSEGDIISYSFLVTNSGNVSLSGPVTINDDKATDESCPAVTTVGNFDTEFDPLESLTCTASYTMAQADLNAGSVTNVASATADGTTSPTDTETVTSVAGKIVIQKETLPDGAGESFSFNPSWSDADFDLKDGQASPSGWLAPGSYSVEETVLAGWDLTDITCSDGNSGQSRTAASVAAINLEANETVTCTFTNTRSTGEMTVVKLIDADGKLETTDDRSPAAGWTFDINGQSTDTNGISDAVTDGDGAIASGLMNTGTYDIVETTQQGYDFMTAYCSDQSGSVEGSSLVGVELNKDDQLSCTFVNTPNGSIHGYKWQDQNGNGQRDEEPLLPDWKINLYQWNGEGYDSTPLKTMLTDSSELHFGWYWFENLHPGKYRVCEELKAGWSQTYPVDPSCHDVELPDDNSNEFEQMRNATDGPAYNFGNQQDQGVLEITKTNNSYPKVQNPGDTITYTLTVTAKEGQLQGVELMDVPQDGFTYVLGSWTASSSVRGNIKGTVTTEPTYSSPGKWLLGEMVKDEVVTLTYKARIGDDVTAGTYPDLAYAYGSQLSGNQIYASAQPLGFISNTYVGTNVVVALKNPSSASYNVEREETREESGQVLGASTELPATGLPVAAPLIALITLIVGGLVTALGWLLRRRQLAWNSCLAVLVSMSIFLGSVTPTLAGESGSLSLRVEQPPSSYNQREFKLRYVVLDQAGRPITISCLKKGPGQAEFTEFSGPTAIKAGGDNHYCAVTSDITGANGTYYFQVIAYAGAESVTSPTISVDLNHSDTPGTPTNYTKNRESCKDILNFRSANDSGKTSRIEIYRSEEKSFTADSGTRIDDFAASSNENYKKEYDRSDCGKTYYYAVRAFNVAGSGSGLVGDTETKVTYVKTATTTTSTTTTVLGALPVPAQQTLAGSSGTEDGAQIGDGAATGDNQVDTTVGQQNANTEDQTQGQVLGESVTNWLASIPTYVWWILVSLVIIALVFAAVRFLR